PSPTPLLFNAFAMQACPLALRASTSLASIQSIGEPFSALEMYAPTSHMQTYPDSGADVSALTFASILPNDTADRVKIEQLSPQAHPQPILALEYAAPQLAEHSGDHSQATPDYETQQDL
ncbi:hypothetical protein GGH92_009575, partial [Coemansia sp. RSA 2673]